MKFITSSINFYPDHSGIALYSTDLPVFLSENGHRVTMVTGFPYYPRWRKLKQDERVLLRSEKYKDIKVFRGYLFVPKKVTTFNRLIHDLTFILFAFINFIRAGKHDIIIIVTPPLLLGLVGVFFKKVWGATLIVHIQDLQLDAALSLAMLKKSLFVNLIDKIDRYIYKRCDLIVPITTGMKEVVLSKGVDKKKIFVVYNWNDVREASEKGGKGIFIVNFRELSNKFLIAYAGNLGIKQGVDVLLMLADATRNNDNIHYLIIGEGADKDRLIKIAKDKGLNNVTFHSLLDQEQYFNMLHDIDIFFVAQKKKTGNVFFPSKLLGIMALSKPILLSADLDSELAQFISENKCGLVAAAGDVATLKRHLEFLYSNQQKLGEIGQQCFSVVQNFDRDKLLSPYMHKMMELSRRI